MTRQALQRKEDVMRHWDIIHAWKDEEYRLSLSEAEREQLPAHPAGLLELTDVQLEHVEGGNLLYQLFEWACRVQTAWEIGSTFVTAVNSACKEQPETCRFNPAEH